MSTIEEKYFISKTGKKVTLRTGAPKDAEILLKNNKIVMGEGLYTLTQPDELKDSIEEQQARIQKFRDHPSHLLVVAECDGEVVGNIDFTNGHRRLISQNGEFGMSISKEYREEGIGTMLLGELIEWAKSHHLIEKINLKAHATNTIALNLYRKFGFIEEGIQKKDMKLNDGSYVDTVLMGKFVK